jgi:hypothetical protein
MKNLLHLYGIKRVFILGAGFSAPFGIPLTRQLLAHVFEIAKTKPWFIGDGKFSPNGMADWLLEQINWYYPLEGITATNIAHTKIDIEQFLSYVAATSTFMFKTSERFNEHGDKFTVFLKCWLGETIAKFQQEALKNETSWFNGMLDLFNNSIVLTLTGILSRKVYY